MEILKDKKPVKIGLVQMAMSHDPEENLSKAVAMTRDAAAKGAQVICLPELFRTPYFPVVEHADDAFVEPIPGRTTEVFSALAKELKIVLVAGSVYELAGKEKFNTAVVYSTDGSVLGTYRKMHIPHDPSFFEQNYFAAGDQGFKVFDTPFCKVAVLICYDQWFPEAARLVSLQGAQVIFYPTAIGTVEGIEQEEGNWQEAWENVQRGHAIANNVIVSAVNRVGKEGKSTFWGGSFVCNAFGKTLVRGSDKEEVLIAEVDLSHNEHVREGWRFFYNRRPETYTQLTK